jgi:glycosyltransferase involved in cell wall biosynthesis
VTASLDGRLGAGPLRDRVPGIRVVLDARPLQEPERAPLTAAYLEGLLGAYDDAPLEGESFALLLQSDLHDPTLALERLEVVGRRMLPPTRLLRSGALTIDPFLLRGAALGAAWRADRGGAAGAVYHAVGGGPLPVASRLPIVVTLLDLAPWEFPAMFQRSSAGRFGQRLRAQLIRDAAAVIVGTEAAAGGARRLLHVRRDRIRIVPLAPRPPFRPLLSDGIADGDTASDAVGDSRADGEADAEADADKLRRDLGAGDRYLVYPGRYDARHDVRSLFDALAMVAAGSRPAGLPPEIAWPLRVLVVGATPDDRAALARAAAGQGVGELFAYVPAVGPAVTAALVRHARAVILPVISDAAGLTAVESISSGTPVVASAVGALPEVVGAAGLLVEPRDAEHLAVALTAISADDVVYGRVADAAMSRASGPRRTWADVAAETRAIYAEVGIKRPARVRD